MRKILLLAGAVIVVFLLFRTPKKETDTKTNTATNNSISKSNDINDVCTYYSKGLIEKAIGRSIVKTEEATLADPTCYYYTSYSDNYEHTPYSDRPGGPHVVVVYDTKDFNKDRAANEKSGSKYETSSEIKMNNYVIKSNVNKIWQVALDLGQEKYIRIKSIDDAVTGEELVKIAAEFAVK